MKNKKSKKFQSKFTQSDLENILSGLTPGNYSFTKRENSNEFNKVLPLLPPSYVSGQLNNLELINLTLSGNTAIPFLLTIAVGRNDRYNKTECFDIDVFNIAPDSERTNSYFLNQWHHFKDDSGKRTSTEIFESIISDEVERKNVLYSTYLTGGTIYSSFNEFEKEKPDFYEIHAKSFGEL